MDNAKILTPDYYAHASYCLDESGKYSFCGGGAGGYGIVLRDKEKSRYMLGLLNSRLLDWYLRKISLRAYRTAYMYVKKYIEQLPIVPDPGRRIETLVDQMVSSAKTLANARTERDRQHYQNKCAALDRRIDQQVYDTYDLTAGEIAVVERSVPRAGPMRSRRQAQPRGQ